MGEDRGCSSTVAQSGYEQIVEALKVLPEQIASQLKGWGSEECISERSWEQTVDLPVLQVMESVEMQLECVAEQITDLPVSQFLGERVQNRTLEQTTKFLVPQILEAVVEVVPPTPQESVQNRVGEQILDSVPQFMEAVMEVVLPTPQESVQNRVGEHIVDSVPRVMKAVVEIVPPTLQERVQNRPRKFFVDLPVPLITEIMADVFGLPQERVQNRATYTGKVFTVRHHRDDCTVDNVEFTKGLDKFNLPRVGDVMVPAPQITKGVVGQVEQVVSWFDWKSQVAADEPLYRFQTNRSGRSSRSKLKR